MNPMEYEYREWLVSLAFDCCANCGEYRELFEYLYSREFVYSIERDSNRAKDGLCMRDTFAELYGYLGIRDYLDMPCNMLEMMFALSDRCERQFMSDPDLGDRTGMWLHNMLTSMGIDDLVDGYFDEFQASRAVDTLLAHSYRKNGCGGLFTVKKRNVDMRNAEIWYQMNWYLAEVSETMDS